MQAIFEATIQVLLSHGADRLTTTRVSERAGISVGALYQYFPNKESLLFAVLEDHLGKVAAEVETACARAIGKPLAEMLREVVEAYVDVKMARTDVSRALYQIAAEVDGPTLVKRTAERSQKALETVLGTASDVTWQPEKFVVQMMFSAMGGATRSVLETGASPPMVQKLRDHLVLLCQSYILAVVRPPTEI